MNHVGLHYNVDLFPQVPVGREGLSWQAPGKAGAAPSTPL